MDVVRENISGESSLNVLHLTNAVGPRSFGVGAIVTQLAFAQKQVAVQPMIWTADDPEEAAAARQRMELPQEYLITYPLTGPRRLWYSPAMERAAITSQAGTFSVLHQHGIWAACTRSSLHWHGKFHHPMVVAAHGELDPWSLQKSSFKKWIALKAYTNRVLNQAACLHATGENEVEAFRQFGLKQPIALIPNGVSPAWLKSSGDAIAFRRQFGIAEDKKCMLYLSRVTPKKGLPLLFEAMAGMREHLEGWILLIVGPDEFNHLQSLKDLAIRLGIDSLIRFLGPIFGENRRDAFAAAELFVLPTRSEGNPMAVLEASGAGLPVLTTRGAPCAYLSENNCGWWTDVDVQSIGEALQDVIGRSPQELKDMGARGRKVIEEKYTWPKVAQMTVQLYEWLLHQGSCPPFVIMN